MNKYAIDTDILINNNPSHIYIKVESLLELETAISHLKQYSAPSYSAPHSYSAAAPQDASQNTSQNTQLDTNAGMQEFMNRPSRTTQTQCGHPLNPSLAEQTEKQLADISSAAPMNEVIEIFEQQTADENDRKYQEATAELLSIKSLARKHGWVFAGPSSLTNTLAEWLEKFAQLGVLYKTQKENLEVTMMRNAELGEQLSDLRAANKDLEARGDRIAHLKNELAKASSIIEIKADEIDHLRALHHRLNQKHQKLVEACRN